MADDELRDLWLDDASEDVMDVDLNALRAAHTKFERDVSRRNLIEVFAAGLVIATFAGMAWTADAPLTAAGAALIAVGAGVVTLVLITRGRAPDPEPAQSTSSFVAQRREALKYQATLLRWVPAWYLSPLVPGAVMFAGGHVAWPRTVGGAHLVVGHRRRALRGVRRSVVAQLAGGRPARPRSRGTRITVASRLARPAEPDRT